MYDTKIISLLVIICIAPILSQIDNQHKQQGWRYHFLTSKPSAALNSLGYCFHSFQCDSITLKLPETIPILTIFNINHPLFSFSHTPYLTYCRNSQQSSLLLLLLHMNCRSQRTLTFKRIVPLINFLPNSSQSCHHLTQDINFLTGVTTTHLT